MPVSGDHAVVVDGLPPIHKDPFDRILVTAAAPEVPEPLLDQLARGGVLVMPIGGKEIQKLTVVEKGSEGEIERREVMAVRFTQLEAGL